MTFRSTALSLGSPGAKPELVAIASLGMTLGECPLWDADRGALWWVDIDAGALYFARPGVGGHQVAEYDEAIGCVGLTEERDLIAGTRSGIRPIDCEGVMQAPVCANPEDTISHRFNDGRVGPDGRLWLGTLSDDKTTPDAGLYSWDGQSLAAHKHGLTISNGLAFSPDNQWMYHSDTPRRLVYRHAFNVETGHVDSGQTWIDFNEIDIPGNPDGAAVDANGHYWCALFGGSAIARFDTDGGFVARYPLAAPNPTMPAFGGDDLKTLFVTTAREGMNDADINHWPAAGSLFAMRLDTPGLPEPRFRPVA